MQLNKVSIRNQRSAPVNHITMLAADSGTVQAMVDAVRQRRTDLRDARSFATLIAAPKPAEGFRDARSSGDTAWALRYRSAIAATLAFVI